MFKFSKCIFIAVAAILMSSFLTSCSQETALAMGAPPELFGRGAIIIASPSPKPNTPAQPDSTPAYLEEIQQID